MRSAEEEFEVFRRTQRRAALVEHLSKLTASLNDSIEEAGEHGLRVTLAPETHTEREGGQQHTERRLVLRIVKEF
jgi:hypothetical protein